MYFSQQLCQVRFQRQFHHNPCQKHQHTDGRADNVPPLKPGIGPLDPPRAVDQLPDVGMQRLCQGGQGLDVRLGLSGLPGGHRLPGHMEPLRQGILGQLLLLAQLFQIFSHRVHGLASRVQRTTVPALCHATKHCALPQGLAVRSRM